MPAGSNGRWTTFKPRFLGLMRVARRPSGAVVTAHRPCGIEPKGRDLDFEDEAINRRYATRR